MKFCSLLRDSIKLNDLFYSTEMLRFDKEMEYRSVTGGLFSLGIIIAVLVGFASMIIDTLALNTINSVQSITKDSTPTSTNITLGSGSNFMLAVQLWGVNTSAPVKYFDVLMIQLSTTNGQRQYNYTLVPLQTCTPEHWSDFPQIATDYDRLNMQNWLCPPRGAILELSGDYTSDIYKYVNISINPCISYLHPEKPCASAEEVSNLFKARNDAIRFKIYYTNPLINSGEKDYKSYYLQTSNYILFGATIGGEAYIYASDYQITTDNSIWPYSSNSEDDGQIIENKLQFHPYTTFQSTYAAFFLVKSPTNYIYQRQVQKISTVFSFIGGLVSAVSAALFIFKAYNTLAFEITVAISIFRPPDDSNLDSSSLSMNFITFFQYNLYSFFKMIGRPRDWPAIAFLTECREEIVNQLDVKALVKRIIFLEYCMTNLFEDYQLEGLQIKKPKVPSDIAKIREKCESLDTYQDHLFFGSSSTNSEKQEGNQSSSTFSHKKRQFDGRNEDITFKIKQRSSECNKIAQFIHTNSISQDSPSQIPSESVFRMLGRNRIQPLEPILSKDSIKEEIIVDPQQVQKLKASLKKHRISKEARLSKAEVRRSINLSFLKKNAEEGNPLSKRIWEQLEYYNSPGKSSFNK